MTYRTADQDRARTSLEWTLREVTRATAAIAAAPPGGRTLLARRLKVLMADVSALAMISDITAGADPGDVAAARGWSDDDFAVVFTPIMDGWLAGDDYPWRPAAAGFPQAVPTDDEDARRDLAAWRAWARHPD